MFLWYFVGEKSESSINKNGVNIMKMEVEFSKPYRVFLNTAKIYSLAVGAFSVFGILMHEGLYKTEGFAGEVLHALLYYGGEILIYLFYFGGFCAPVLFILSSVIYTLVKKDKGLIFNKNWGITLFMLTLCCGFNWWFMFYGA